MVRITWEEKKGLASRFYLLDATGVDYGYFHYGWLNYGEDTLHDIDTNVDDMMMSKKLHCILKYCGVWLKSFNVE